jgi:hypothetical protein
MHPARIRPKRRKTVLALTLALGVGLPSPAQAYLLDFTVLSINPEVFISYAPGTLSRPPPVGGNLKVIDVSRRGGLGRQFNPTDTVLNRILNFPTGPLVDYVSNVASAPYVEEFGGLSPQANFNPVYAVRFTSIPGASASTMVPRGNILNHLAPLSSTLLLLGSGLMGLVGLRYRRRRG